MLSCADDMQLGWITFVLVPNWATAKSREGNQESEESIFFGSFLGLWPEGPTYLSAYPEVGRKIVSLGLGCVCLCLQAGLCEKGT